MALIGRRRRMRQFHRDVLLVLERFGRYEFDPSASGIDSSNIYRECVIPFWEFAQEDADAFLSSLHAVVAADEGGFATFGAARLAWEFYGEKCLSMAAAWPLIDAGIEFKLARHLPIMLTGYEHQRLAQRARAEEQS